jgi:hypothetical protein
MPAARIMPEGLLTPEAIVVSQESELKIKIILFYFKIELMKIIRATEQHVAVRDPPTLADSSAGPFGRAQSVRTAAARTAPRRALAQGGDARQKGRLLPL